MTPRTEPFTAPVPLPGGAGDARRRELLQSVVEVARAIFGAAAGSVLLLDEECDELVFAAVSGEGEEFLVGRRFPAGSGIAGWVATSGEPVVVDDLTASRSFDRSVAESTEYVPDALMAAPLVSDGRVLGVLEVLDPSPQARSGLPELDLLALFARQAATALRVVSPDPPAALPPSRRADALRLLGSLEQLLRESA
ncbi:GAF domain-containing protein [Streptomyces albidoflavus]|uniref:GAF domain-containing protein n=1 Tax=Streptomyces sp. DR3-1 TaxID=2951169 RepID=UPI000CB2D38A|nr:GAF domain-containing protein [Streptomyces sp. DR3-1]MCM3820956.1 GAF domain-containing protein [Streptomyces sp. DR3-1]PJT46300.1 GAF domain-containing protein [Streptomyces albidoflavus]